MWFILLSLKHVLLDQLMKKIAHVSLEKKINLNTLDFD